MIRLQGIKKQFFTENGKRGRYILKGIDLTLPNNGLVSILGPSGCGKTTFLNILSLLETPDEGKLFFNDVDSTTLSESQKDEFRHLRIGYIYQEYNLIRHLTVRDNIKLAFNLGSTMSKFDENARITMLMEEFNISHLSDQYPSSLSGGEKERVAIARALANNPDIILADEPTGALDDYNAEEVMKALKELSKTKLVVMVSHNEALVERFSDRIIRFHDGYVYFDSSPLLMKSSAPLLKKKSTKRLFSIFPLALKRVKAKKGRYLFLGIINTLGIIGIAIAMGVRSGAAIFSKNAELDALRAYPLTVSNIYYGSANSFVSSTSTLRPTDGYIHRIQDDDSTTHVNAITNEYISYVKSEFNKRNIDEDCLVLRKGLAPNIITKTEKGEYVSFEATDVASFTGFESLWREAANYFRPMMGGLDMIHDTFDVVWGDLPKNDNELLVVLDSYDSFPTYMLNLLGFENKDIKYEEIAKKTFKFVNNNEYYGDKTMSTKSPNSVKGKFIKSNEQLKAEGKQADEIQPLLIDAIKYYDAGGPENIAKMNEVLSEVETYFEETEKEQDLYFWPDVARDLQPLFEGDAGHEMVVSGIIRPKSDVLFAYLQPGFYYTNAYSDLFLEENLETDLAIEYQKHLTFERKNNLLSVPDAYEIIGSAQKVKKSDYSDMSGTYSYLMNRKAFGVDESYYQLEIIAKDFEMKQRAVEVLEDWNKTHEGPEKVYFSDIGAMVVNLVDTYVGILVTVLVAVIGVVIFSNLLVTSLLAILEINSRTREIGLYRSLGATSSYVRTLFMAEQGLLGLFSGALGTGITFGFIPLMNYFIEHSVKSSAIISNFIHLEWWMGIVVALVSIFIGILSALAPAIIATKKKPSQALRGI